MKLKGSLARFLLPALLIPTIISLGLDRQNNSKSTQVTASPNNWGTVSEGFQLSAEMEKELFKLGTPILLKLTVKNISSRTLKLPVSYPEIDYKVTIKDEKGEIIPLTQYGEAMRNRPEMTRNYLLEMKPGQQVSEQLSLDKVVNITKSGSYVVSVRRKILRQSDKAPEVGSKTIQFRISK